MQYQGEVKLNPDGVLCKSFKSSGLLKAAGGAAGAGGGPQIQPPVHGVQIKLKQFSPEWREPPPSIRFDTDSDARLLVRILGDPVCPDQDVAVGAQKTLYNTVKGHASIGRHSIGA